jgi:hypothetical protein
MPPTIPSGCPSVGDYRRRRLRSCVQLSRSSCWHSLMSSCMRASCSRRGNPCSQARRCPAWHCASVVASCSWRFCTSCCICARSSASLSIPAVTGTVSVITMADPRTNGRIRALMSLSFLSPEDTMPSLTRGGVTGMPRPASMRFSRGSGPAGGLPRLSRPSRSMCVAGCTSLARGAAEVARAQMTSSLLVGTS